MAKSNFGRKVVTAGLALALGLGGVLAPVTTAWAATGNANTVPSVDVTKGPVDKETEHTVTLSGAVAGADYHIIPLATGSFMVEDDGTLSMGDVTVNPDAVDALVATLSLGDDWDAGMTTIQRDEALVEKIAGLSSTDDSAEYRTFANALAARLASLCTDTNKMANTSGTLAATVPSGYYIVISGSTGYDSANKTSAILVPVAGNVTGAVKADTEPTVTKTALNSTSGLLGGQLDTTFTITVSLPSNFMDYTTYKLAITDTLPEGMDVTSDELVGDEATWNLTIKAGDADVTDQFELTSPTQDASGSFTFTCNNLRGITDENGALLIGADTVITMTYQMALDSNDRAKLYGDAASLTSDVVNVANIEFSNSPYSEGTGNTDTGDDDPNEESSGTPAALYDFDLKLTKIDEDGQPLAGATFTLTADGEAAGYIISDTSTEANNGVIEFHGLGANTVYTLTEVTAPAGMKKIDPITFKISATIDEDTGRVTAIEVVDLNDPGSALGANGLTVTNAVVSGDVRNIEGTDLPLTGAAGIGAGVVVGGLLIAVSAYKAKKNAEEDC